MSSNEFISKYEQYFSNRLHENLPPSSEGIVISNIDFVICNYETKKFILLELKTCWKTMERRQRWLYNMLHKRLMYANNIDEWKFMWTFLVTFEGKTFQDWSVWIEGSNLKSTYIFDQELKDFIYNLIN